MKTPNWFMFGVAVMNIASGCMFAWRQQWALGISWMLFGAGSAVQAFA